MDQRFKKLDEITTELMEIEVEGRKLKEHFRYKDQDYAWFYQKRLLNNFYDPMNLKFRSDLFLKGTILWRKIQGKCFSKKRKKYEFLLFDRPAYTKFKKNYFQSMYHESIIENLPPEKTALVVDLSLKEFLKYLHFRINNCLTITPESMPKKKNVINFWSFYQPPEKKKKKKLRQLNTFVKENRKIKEFCQEKKINYFYFLKINQLILNYYFPTILTYQETFNHLLDHFPVKQILISTDGSSLRVAVTSVRRKKIESYSLQHGDNTREKMTREVYQKTLPEALPDYFFVYSEEEKKTMEVNSNKYFQLKALGCPRYDFLKTFHTDPNKLRKKYKIGQEQKILFWPTHSHALSKEENKIMAKVVFDYLKNNLNYFVIIKLHPREEKRKWLSFYQKEAKKRKLKNVLILPADAEDTLNCIFVSDAILMKKTSVGTEAILLNKPVIILNLLKTIPLGYFETEKMGLIVNKERELASSLEQIYQPSFQREFQKKRETFLKKHFPNFGCSGRKIAEFMLKPN